MQSIYCTVLPTSYVFLPSNIKFPNLSKRIYFFGETCFLAFLESSELILLAVGTKYGRGFIFPVL